MDTGWFISSIVCGLLGIIAIGLNAFFIHCLWYRQEDSLQHPLKLLLDWTVGLSFFFHTETLFMVFSHIFDASPLVSLVVDVVYYFLGCTALVSPSWLSIFYYCSIVPPEFGIMKWAKRNVGLVVFCIAVTNCILISLSTVLLTVTSGKGLREGVLGISNLTNISSSVKEGISPVQFSFSSVLYIIHLQLSFWTLALTWGGTFIYLRKHMKAMENSGSCSLSQMRVTIVGMVQAAFFLPGCLWITVVAFFNPIFPIYFDLVIICSLLGFINSVCLGLAQSIFRKPALLMMKTVWDKLKCR